MSTSCSPVCQHYASCQVTVQMRSITDVPQLEKSKCLGGVRARGLLWDRVPLRICILDLQKPRNPKASKPNPGSLDVSDFFGHFLAPHLVVVVNTIMANQDNDAG